MVLNSVLKYFAFIGASVLLTMSTMIFGALPMLPARRAFGRIAFWGGFLAATALVFAAGLPFYALVLLALTVLVGVYAEIKDHGGQVVISGATGLLASTGTIVVALGVWSQLAKLRLSDEIRRMIEPFVAQLAQSTGSTITVEAVLQQLPSAVFIMLSLALALALIVERRLSQRFLASTQQMKTAESAPGSQVHAEEASLGLTRFRLPDAAIWMTVAAIAGSFLNHGHALFELVSLNLLNILVVLFFFQGLAVITFAFRTFQVGPVWQAIWYVLLILQLFLMVSLIGFIDYWLEFRERLSRKPVETKREF